MKKINLLALSFWIVVSLLPLGYLAFIWHKIPAVVPTHFDRNFEPNDFSPRRMLWIINGGLAAVSIGVYLLLKNIRRIDPKRAGQLPSRRFDTIGSGVVMFLSAINIITILASTGHAEVLHHLLLPLVGLLFVFLGNVMFTIRPNYFAGFRLPWTLADDANWRATHLIGGIVWFAGGIVLAVASIVSGGAALQAVLLSDIAVMVAVPSIYSFWYFKRHGQQAA